MMNLFAKDGTAKLVPQCTYPLTGLRCVSRVYTDHAIFDIDSRATDAFGCSKRSASRCGSWLKEWQ